MCSSVFKSFFIIAGAKNVRWPKSVTIYNYQNKTQLIKRKYNEQKWNATKKIKPKYKIDNVNNFKRNTQTLGSSF